MKSAAIFFLLLLQSFLSFSRSSDTVSKHKYRGAQLLAGYGSSYIGKPLDNVGLPGHRTYENYFPTSIFSLNYRYHKSRKVSYGITLAYENESGAWNDVTVIRSPHQRDVSFISVPLGVYSKYCITLAPEITFTYWDIQKKHFVRLYGAFGMGVFYKNETGTYDTAYYNSKFVNGMNSLGDSRTVNKGSFHVDYQWSLVGIHVGHQLGGFMEFGIGYKGLIVLGMSYKF